MIEALKVHADVKVDATHMAGDMGEMLMATGDRGGALSFVTGAALSLVRDFTYDIVFPSVYWRNSKRPIDQKKALFVEVTRSEPSNSLHVMWDVLEERGFSCEFATLERGRAGRVRYYRNCLDVVRRAATARMVVICEACGPLGGLRTRKGTDIVQLWHGCGAFKRFGMSTADKIFGGSREEKLRHPEHASTTLVTVSSPEVVWAYVEAMGMEDRPEVVQPLGVSRTDLFFDVDYVTKAREEVTRAVPEARGKKVLLYAPTFRGRVLEAKAPDRLDVGLLASRLSDEWVLLIKHHPHIKERPDVPSGCASFAYDVTDRLSIESCLCAADACISDYSSLVFEYSLFRRPMAFFAYDLEDYDDWRGFYYPYEEMTPGPIFVRTEELADWVANLSDGFDTTVVDAFRERFMSACDGHATQRIVDAVLGLGK